MDSVGNLSRERMSRTTGARPTIDRPHPHRGRAWWHLDGCQPAEDDGATGPGPFFAGLQPTGEQPLLRW